MSGLLVRGSVLDASYINLKTISLFIAVLLFVYVVYQRYLHPLARFPGPFWASLTDLWQVNQFLQGQQPYCLAELHSKYGPIIRYGPDKLSVVSEDAIQTIYVKNAKIMPKTEYYNSFGIPGRPNLFNMTNKEDHVLRRRHLLKFFSPQVVETYESLIDEKVHELRLRIREHAQAKSPSPLDLKSLFWDFMSDVISLVVYGESWNLLGTDESHGPIDIHVLSLWGALSGAWSAGEPVIKLLIMLVPHRWAYKACWQNIWFGLDREKHIKARFTEIEQGIGTDRKDILTKMILGAREKGTDGLTAPLITVECLDFLIAGVHPPAAALTMLFYHLLHNPTAMREAAEEIQSNLPPLSPTNDAYSSSSIEQNLPFLRNCLTENFRITPVFTMPLPRRVVQNAGLIIDGHVLPQGTSVAVCNHAFHHNSNIWPVDHETFNPSRWDDADARSSELKRLLMHFGAGTRQCIGKVLATTIIYKVAGALISEFNFELMDSAEQQKAEDGVFRGKMPRMSSVGISELEGPLLVRVRSRQ